MGVPQSRASKQRKRMRRAHYKAETPTLTLCQRCKAPKRPHAVCPNCGYYKGRQVMAEEKA
ncbi:50S ribosomal protein L32 [Desulfothermobacter acidiphilus]|uniref:50S ribosomal protein L32 n=1 Tax=Desulfothermobacter acidiphilus TaxID=1938353 RepID=UPI003F89173A